MGVNHVFVAAVVCRTLTARHIHIKNTRCFQSNCIISQKTMATMTARRIHENQWRKKKLNKNELCENWFFVVVFGMFSSLALIWRWADELGMPIGSITGMARMHSTNINYYVWLFIIWDGILYVIEAGRIAEWLDVGSATITYFVERIWVKLMVERCSIFRRLHAIISDEKNIES